MRTGPILIEWTGPRGVRVRAGDGALDWTVQIGSTQVTRVFNRLAAALPARAWRSGPVLALMSRVAGTALQAGRVRLTGLAPNGQRFAANPRIIWLVVESTATVGGVDLGEIGPAPEQGRLADFSIPQRGVFVVGSTTFIDSPA